MKRFCILIMMMVGCLGFLTAQTYRVGDVYTAPDGSRGIVFYLLPNGTGGWVVALTDASPSCSWGDETDVPGLVDQNPQQYQNLLYDTAGYASTQTIRNYQNNSTYAAGVVDFGNGWYLPSPAQLRMLHAKMPLLASSLAAAGGVDMAKALYWCSAEQNSHAAWQVDFGNQVYHGRFLPANKTDLARVRAVRSFTYEPTYVWSTGDTTPTITVAQNQATTYTVTVTDPYGCESSVAKHIAMRDFAVPQSERIYLCEDSSTVLTAREASAYLWNTGDTSQTIFVSDAGLFTVTAIFSDNCWVTDTFKVISVRVNGISNIDIPEMCAGNEYPIVVGHDAACNMTFATHRTILALHDTVFLPDGVECEPYGCSYQSSLTFAGYKDTARVNSVNDIRYLRINMEHSYLGDLYMSLKCPDERQSTIMRYGGYTTQTGDCFDAIPASQIGWQSGNNYTTYAVLLGMAYDETDFFDDCDAAAEDNAPGMGWNYCWSNNNRYSYAPGAGSLVYRTANVHKQEYYFNTFSFWGNDSVYIVDSSNVANGTHFYHPDQSFENLIGCPLNGQWTIEVIDGHGWDNGYIFGWELALAEDIQTVEYADVEHTTVEGPWVTTINDSSFVISPPDNLLNDTVINYTFHCISPFGCGYDTVVGIQFYARNLIETDTFVCGRYKWKNRYYTQSADFSDTLTNIHGCDSVMLIHFIVVEPPQNMVYAPEEICPGATAELTACDAASYLWGTGETTQSITVSDSGIYSVNITDIHGCSFDTAVHISLSPLVYTYVDTVVCDQLEWMDTTFSESGEYMFNFSRENGCDSVVVLNLIIVENPIVGAYLLDMVVGDTQTVVVGHLEEDNLQYLAPITTLGMADTVFLPDGVSCDPYGCSYLAMLTFSDFADTDTIRSVEDIHYVRLNMEHSFSKDLYISLSCPNGQHATILRHGGNGTSSCLDDIPVSDIGWQGPSTQNVGESLFGWAYDVANTSSPCNPSSTGNGPGIGWNYCWSNNTTENYQYAAGEGSLVYRKVNSHQYPSVYGLRKMIIDSSDVAAGTQFYHPDESFDSLVGCPLNGTWTIEVMDGLINDNGYLFFWEISLADDLIPNHYAPVVQMGFDGPWVTRLDDSTFVIIPPEDLAGDTLAAYTFSLADTVGCPYDTTVYIHIYANRYTELYDTVLMSDLDYSWNDSIFTGPGSKTVVLSTVNGADSIVTMHLSVIYSYDTVICEDKLPLTWHNHLFEGSDSVVTHFPVNGADSIEVLALTALPVTSRTLSVIRLENDLPYIQNDSSYWETGTYTQHLVNAVGCDSVLTIELVVINNSTIPMDTVVCEDQLPLTWHGLLFLTAGTQYDTLTASTGADSILMLTVNALALSYDTLRETVVENNLPYMQNDSVYWESGTYTQYLTNMAGCDSVLTIELVVFHNSTIVMDTAVCENQLPLVWHGVEFLEAGTYYDTLTASTGADSVLVMTLTVKDTTSETLHIGVIENNLPFVINGYAYDTTGTYIQHLTNAAGCDSMLTIVLTVYENAQGAADSVVCSNDLPFVWNGVTFYRADTLVAMLQTVNGADSLVVMSLAVKESPEAHITGPEILCNGQPVVLAADSAVTYLWSTGATTSSITVDEVGTYFVTVTNEYGCADTALFHLTHLVTVFPIDTVQFSDMCAGEEYPITIGHRSNSSIVIATPTQNTLSWADTVFLPDGVNCAPFGCSYRSPLTFSDFPENGVVTSEDDIMYVRINMEHSFAGDLYINITCPNGQKADIMRFGGSPMSSSDCNSLIPDSSREWTYGLNAYGSTFFGMAYDYHQYGCNPNVPNNAPGIGWNYCWSNNGTAGYTYAPGEGSLIYRYQNSNEYLNPYFDGGYDSIVYVFDSSDVAAGTHFYHPDQSFSSLIGCPLNGSWYIEVLDGWSADNGYLFEWELSLASYLVPGEHTDVTHVTVDGPWVTPVSDTAFIFSPPADLERDTVVTYTFHLTDEYGCGYDTVIVLNVFPQSHTVVDTAVCDSILWHGVFYAESGQYIDTLANQHGCDSTVTLNLTVYHTPDVYIAGPSSICPDSVAILSVDSNASYLWSTGDTTRTIIVSEAGIYSVTVTEGHGCGQSSSHNVEMPENPILSVKSPELCASATYPITAGAATSNTVVITPNADLANVNVQGAWLSVESDIPTVNPPAALDQDSVLVYAVMLEDLNGCRFDTTVVVTVYHLAHFSFDTVVCGRFSYADSVYTQSGSFERQFVDAHGCDSTVTFTLTVHPLPEAHIFGSDVLCAGSYTVLTSDSASAYLWSTGDTTRSVQAYSVGTYSLTVTNEYGCSATDSFLIEHLVTVDAIDSIPLSDMCAGNSYAVSVGHLSCSVDGPWVTAVTDTTFVFSPSANLANDTMVSYTFHFYDENGCSYDTTIMLNVFTQSHTSVDTTVCDLFTWDGVPYSESGQYTRVFENQHGCDSTVVINLTVVPSPVAHITGASWICADSTILLSADSCDTYLWNTGDTTRTVAVTAAGTYSVTVTEAHGCSHSATQIVTAPDNPILSVSAPEICSNATYPITVGTAAGSTVRLSQNPSLFTIDVQGLWLSGGEQSAMTVSPPAALASDTTVVYTVLLSDDNGCHFDTTFTLTAYSLHHSSFDTVVCDSFSYADSVYTQAGLYERHFVDAHGCDSTVTFTLTVHYSVTSHDTLHLVQNQLPYYIEPANVTIAVPADAQYQYSLSTVDGCDSLVQLQVYVYPNVSITTDTMVCSSALPLTWHGHTFTAAGTVVDSLLTVHGTDSVLIYQVSVDNIAASIGTVTHVVCYGASTGAAIAQVTGGQIPLVYQWQSSAGNTVSTSVQLNNAIADSYTFTVTDQLGCVATDTVTIRTLNGEMVAGTIADNQSVCAGESLTAFTGTAASGGDNSNYQWQYSEDGVTWTAAPGTSTAQSYTYPEPFVEESFQLRRAWISASCGTVYSDTVTVTVWPSYNDTLTAEICQGGSYTENGFEVDGAMTGIPGVFYFEQHLSTGHCDSVVVLQLTINQVFESYIEDEVCEGEGYSANGFDIPATATVGTDSLIRSLMLTTDSGCDSVVQLHLTVVDTSLRIISLTSDFCEGLSEELSVETSMTNYMWNTGEQMPQITVTVPGVYSVTASQGNCSATARYTVEPCELRMILPNAISPSRSEGLNDYFCVPEALLPSVYDFEISVFNRWGEMVYYSTDKYFKWNGEVKGKIYYNNVYNYIIRCTNAQGKPFVFQGSITVL